MARTNLGGGPCPGRPCLKIPKNEALLMQFIDTFSQNLRNQRKNLFYTRFNLQSGGKKILDLGGTPWSSFCQDLADCEVTYLNLYSEEIVLPRLTQPNHHYVCADARHIPFADRHFDIVFSNSLIEHVGDFEAQTQVAQEIQRVGKAYWIQTPYKHFPIEPHYNFPLYQYLPASLQRQVHHTWKFSWVKQHGLPFEEIFLLDRQQMQQLFRHAHLYEEKLFFLTKSITAIQT
jgi:hypothetical protein